MGDLTRLGKIGDTVNSLFSDTKPLLWFDRGSDKQLGWRSDGPGKSFGRSIRASFFLGGNIDGHSRILNWRYLPYIRPIFQAYVREYPHKIWPYMVQYLHFRILETSHWRDYMIPSPRKTTTNSTRLWRAFLWALLGAMSRPRSQAPWRRHFWGMWPRQWCERWLINQSNYSYMVHEP